VGRTKLGNAKVSAITNNRKKAMETPEELVEFSTGEDLKRNRPNENNMNRLMLLGGVFSL
jgi:hypothetical protein